MYMKASKCGDYECPTRVETRWFDDAFAGLQQQPCSGPACPAWRWFRTSEPGYPLSKEHGFCGLGGDPGTVGGCG